MFDLSLLYFSFGVWQDQNVRGHLLLPCAVVLRIEAVHAVLLLGEQASAQVVAQTVCAEVGAAGVRSLFHARVSQLNVLNELLYLLAIGQFSLLVGIVGSTSGLHLVA